MSTIHRNISFATADSFREVLANGSVVTVRGDETKELRNRVTNIQRPLERCLFLPGRNHNVFAQVAETMWVVDGRNDVPWLARYLERAPNFSDDGGATWHGAYGPRLRRWPGGVDQLDEWRNLFRSDRATRRAAGVLFDPSRDFLPSGKDIPCNNWLSWLLRDGRLNLSVAIRSNDAMWGFSGVNAFEWSVLQEMLAYWLVAEVGDVTYFATSYHLYRPHYARANNIVRGFFGLSPYDFGISSPRFLTNWEEFPDALQAWFAAEGAFESEPDKVPAASAAMEDPLLGSMLGLLRLKWGSARWTRERLADELAAMPENDFTAAAYEHFGRAHPALLDAIPHARIAKFFAACRSAKASGAADLKNAIKHLHTRKNASYAASWKRRGERVSILPNIARKVDRLQAFFDEGKILAGETVLDTAVDLLVYAIKYVLFLAEHPGADRSALPAMAREPLSDFDENFSAVLDALTIAGGDQDIRALAERVHSDFERMWQAVDAGSDLKNRQQQATSLMTRSAELVGLVAMSFPGQTGELISKER